MISSPKRIVRKTIPKKTLPVDTAVPLDGVGGTYSSTSSAFNKAVTTTKSQSGRSQKVQKKGFVRSVASPVGKNNNDTVSLQQSVESHRSVASFWTYITDHRNVIVQGTNNEIVMKEYLTGILHSSLQNNNMEHDHDHDHNTATAMKESQHDTTIISNLNDTNENEILLQQLASADPAIVSELLELLVSYLAGGGTTTVGGTVETQQIETKIVEGEQESYHKDPKPSLVGTTISHRQSLISTTHDEVNPTESRQDAVVVAMDGDGNDDCNDDGNDDCNDDDNESVTEDDLRTTKMGHLEQQLKPQQQKGTLYDLDQSMPFLMSTSMLNNNATKISRSQPINLDYYNTAVEVEEEGKYTKHDSMPILTSSIANIVSISRSQSRNLDSYRVLEDDEGSKQQQQQQQQVPPLSSSMNENNHDSMSLLMISSPIANKKGTIISRSQSRSLDYYHILEDEKSINGGIVFTNNNNNNNNSNEKGKTLLPRRKCNSAGDVDYIHFLDEGTTTTEETHQYHNGTTGGTAQQDCRKSRKKCSSTGDLDFFHFFDEDTEEFFHNHSTTTTTTTTNAHHHHHTTTGIGKHHHRKTKWNSEGDLDYFHFSVQVQQEENNNNDDDGENNNNNNNNKSISKPYVVVEPNCSNNSSSSTNQDYNYNENIISNSVLPLDQERVLFPMTPSTPSTPSTNKFKLRNDIDSIGSPRKRIIRRSRLLQKKMELFSPKDEEYKPKDMSLSDVVTPVDISEDKSKNGLSNIIQVPVVTSPDGLEEFFKPIATTTIAGTTSTSNRSASSSKTSSISSSTMKLMINNTSERNKGSCVYDGNRSFWSLKSWRVSHSSVTSMTSSSSIGIGGGGGGVVGRGDARFFPNDADDTGDDTNVLFRRGPGEE